jgi:arylsulfatase A-like enzyme
MSPRTAAGLAFCSLALSIPQPSPAGEKRPNIVVILSDDQGYADISCYDHPREVRTPHMDRLAREGIRLTSGYASCPVCAPTRAGLLTGRYQQRFGFYTASDSRAGLPTKEVTLADLLKKAGYRTGVVGKWHLGYEEPYRPLRRGFDEFYGFLGHGGHDYFDLKRSDPIRSIYRNDRPIDDTGYLTHNLTREAVSFIKRHHERPFFLYLAYNAVHNPLQAPESQLKRFDTGNKKRDTYLAMLACLDEGVGAVLDELKKTGVEENTLVVFLTDNGGAKATSANNGALRGFKHSVYEGGIRVPFLFRWPGHVPAGKVCDEPIICQDIFATALAAAGVKVPDDRPIDGKDVLPVLQGKRAGALHRALYWNWIDKNSEKGWAVREGKWKLLVDKRGKELYDLSADLGEKDNRIAEEPDVARRLLDRYRKWSAEMAPRIKRKRGKRAGR